MPSCVLRKCTNYGSKVNKTLLLLPLTGGGKDYCPPDEVLDNVASLLAKKSFRSETSRPSSPRSEYPIRANHTFEPQAVNDKKQEEHENNKTLTYLKDIKDLLEKTLDKGESRRDNLRPKRRLMQEASVSKQKAPQSSNAKETFSPETSRQSTPLPYYTVEPQAVNDKKQEEHENNKTFTYLKDIKDLIEKTLDKEDIIRDNLRPKRRLMQEASVSKQKAPQSSNAKETFSPKTSRPSSPQSEYPLQTNYTVAPQAVNDKNQEEHENNKTFTYLKDIKDLIEKTLDEEESRRDNLRPKRRLMQEASVSKQKAPRSSNALHEEIDGDKHFVLSLVPTLKQMSDDQKLAAKMRILQTLQEVRKMNIHQNIMYVEDSTEDALKVEYLDEDNSDSSSS